MSSFRSFEEIKAWQVSRELAKEIYKITSTAMFAADRGLKYQIRRAAVSVVSNIAEGFERGGNKEFIQFLFQAKGSCGEVRAQLYLCRDLGYMNEETFQNLRSLVMRASEMIWGMIRYLKVSELKGTKYTV